MVSAPGGWLRRLSFLAALVVFGSGTTPAFASWRAMPVITYGPDRGLSGHAVTSLAADRAGRLWVGTWGGGAFRYDGIAWKPITSRDGLLSDRVTSLVAGANGEIWVSCAPAPGSKGGLTVVQGERVLPVEGQRWETTTGIEGRDGSLWLALRGGGVARYAAGSLAAVAGLDGLEVSSLVEGENGQVWMMGRPRGQDSTRPGALAMHDGRVLRTLGAGDGLPASPFRALIARRDGSLWLATGSGLYRSLGGRFEAASFGGTAVARPLYSLSEDADGRLWMGAEGAVLVADHERVSELKLPVDFGLDAVLAVEASPAGGVFLATSTHVIRLEGRAAEVFALEPRANLVAAGSDEEQLDREAELDRIAERGRPLLIDHEGGTWAVSGRSVVRYAGDDARRFGRDEGLASDDVRALQIDSRGFVWAGTAAGLARMDPANGYFEPVSGVRGAVLALFEDRGGVLYAAGERVYKLDGLSAAAWPPAEGLSAPQSLAAGPGGNLWIGAATGLARVTWEGLERFDSGPRAGAEASGLPASPVLCLLDVDGELWAGHASGLSHQVGERFERLPAFDRIRVNGLLIHGEGEARRLLAVTPGGLRSVPDARPAYGAVERTTLGAAWIDRRGTLWQGLELGLLASSEGAEILHSGGAIPPEPARAFAEDTQGRLWIATRRGLYRHAPRVRPPTVWIDRASVGGGPDQLDTTAVVAAAECRTVEVGWAGVSFIGPRDSADLRFEQRLLPVEKEWSAASSARTRRLVNLAPDRYTFEVRAVSRDLGRSEPARIAVTVGREDQLPEPGRLLLPEIAKP